MNFDLSGALCRCRSTALVTIFVAGLTASAQAIAAAVCPSSVPVVALTRASAVRVLPKVKAYTEGLIYSDGALYESTGGPGHSSLVRIDLRSFIPTTVNKLDDKYFGEGLTEIDKRLVQLTWKDNIALIYGQDQQHPRVISRPGEAWGLTTVDRQLVMSDGSSNLSFLDPNTLATTRQVTVRYNQSPEDKLNELEYAHGHILANVYGGDWVLVIDPKSGCVDTFIDLSKIRTPELNDIKDAVCAYDQCSFWDFVANGIAFDAKNDEIYFTGKNWPYIFVFKYPASP